MFLVFQLLLFLQLYLFSITLNSLILTILTGHHVAWDIYKH